MVDSVKGLKGIIMTYIDEPFAMSCRKSSFNKNMSISVEWCFLNPNWFTHVVKKVETLDNIKD